MPSDSYIRKRRKIAKEKSKLGVEARRRKREAEASEMRVTGVVKTSGIFGEHEVQFLDFGDERLGYVRVDGELRRPRTVRGFEKTMDKWLWKKGNK